MKIRIRFIAVDAPNLPPVGADGCAVLDIAEGLTVDHALANLALPDGSTYLTLVNEDSIPITERCDRSLLENDLLTIFIPLKGG